MTSWHLLQSSLFSPMVLAFFLGLFTVIVKSDLKLPEGLYNGLSMYLLLALGIKGGALLSDVPFEHFFLPCLFTLFLGILSPWIAYLIGHFLGRLSVIDAAALAAHYGSVSVVTFIACQVFLETLGQTYEQIMTALVVVLEVPGIVVALLIAEKVQKCIALQSGQKRPGIIKRIKAILYSKSIFLLLGGLVIGLISGKPGLERVKPFFVDPFQGILVFFMLDMGVVAGMRLRDFTGGKTFLIMFSVFMPIINACLGIVAGYWAGLSIGGTVVLATMAASASYIAAPAAVRISLPAANPAYYLTCAIVLTFPFNLTIGIPLYYQLTKSFFALFS